MALVDPVNFDRAKLLEVLERRIREEKEAKISQKININILSFYKE